MRTIVFDTEGNGERDDHICQLSYLIRDGDNYDAKNFYFTVDVMNPYAQKVHGLSRMRLHELSGGRRFKDDADEIFSDFNAADIIVGHNIRSDVDRLNLEFERLGLKYTPKHCLCTMKHFNNAMQMQSRDGHRKYPKLSELCAYYNVADDVILQMCRILFNADGAACHDARYDASATYLCLLAAKRSGDIRMVF